MNLETYGIAPDGAILQWAVFYNGTPRPGIVIIHGGGFHGGGPLSPDLVPVANDLAAYFTIFSITYRLDDKSKLPGQTSNGKWPQQTDDVKTAVQAARYDARTNGVIGAVGGSAGGTHAASVALEDFGSNWSTSDQVSAAVCMSGAYFFGDRTPNPALNAFVNNINQYTGTNSPSAQAAMGPSNYSSNKPMFLVSSENDPMPVAQYNLMMSKLNTQGGDHAGVLLPGSAHAFDNWTATKDQIIPWLTARLV